MQKEYWIVNTLYACPTRERAEELDIDIPKTIEHVVVVDENMLELLEWMEWLRTSLPKGLK